MKDFLLLCQKPSFVVGFIGGLCTTGSFVPHVLKVIASGSVEGLSFPMFLIHFIGDLLWVAYGVMIDDIILISFETLVSFLNIIILGYFIKHYMRT